MQQAWRSVIVRIANRTGFEMVRSTLLVHKGRWSKLPPEKIPPNTEVEFGTESIGKLHSTHCSIGFKIKIPSEDNKDEEYELSFAWSNPNIGSFKEHHTTQTSKVVVETDCTNENRAFVTFAVQMSSNQESTESKEKLDDFQLLDINTDEKNGESIQLLESFEEDLVHVDLSK